MDNLMAIIASSILIFCVFMGIFYMADYYITGSTFLYVGVMSVIFSTVGVLAAK